MVDEKRLNGRTSEGEVAAMKAMCGEQDKYIPETMERIAAVSYRAETELWWSSENEYAEDQVGQIYQKRVRVRELEDEVELRDALRRQENVYTLYSGEKYIRIV